MRKTESDLMLEAQAKKLQGNGHTADVRQIEHTNELHGLVLSVAANV